MKKTGKCKELFDAEAQNNGKMPTLKCLEEQYAKKLEQAKGTHSEAALKAEFKKLFNQKTLLTGAPVLFGFTVMGLFVAGCSRFFTQYRFNKEKENKGQKT